MCGILGIVNVENYQPINSTLLEKMAKTMSHRGPDDSGFWVQQDGQLGLAHRRLSIVDLSPAGHQPMSTTDKRIWVVFNGEIYNYLELRKELEARGHKFRSNSDTEVILYLYREHGERFYEHLDGDFGIGLWDSDSQRLILARDRAGVKPVYYTYVDGRFVFASEIKALLRYPGVDRTVDKESFYHYLTYLVTPPPRTLIKGIYKLGAACTIILEPKKGYFPRLEKYWLPLPNVNNHVGFDELDEELESIFSRSVKKRLMADVPVGVLFSGGVDSTLNLCSFGKLVAPEKVKTFTIGMDNGGGFHDDSTVARKVALRLGSDHHEVRINEVDLLNTAEKLALIQDEPVSDPVAVPLYFITKFAKEQGVTVLQAGEGADELFCGYDNYRRFIKHNNYLWGPLSKLPRWVSKAGSMVISKSKSPKNRKICDVLARNSKGQEIFMSSAVAYYELEKQRILSPELRYSMNDIDSFDVVAPYYDQIENKYPDASFLQKMTYIELQLRLPELLLMRADKMSMANSLEIRVPFLDRDLMDFAMRCPDSYKLRDGVSKEPIKKLAAKFLNKEDVYRPKTGFGVPIQQWFKGRLGESLLDLISESNHSSDFFNRKEVEHNLKRGLRTVNEAFQLWVIYNMLMWQEGLRQK